MKRFSIFVLLISISNGHSTENLKDLVHRLQKHYETISTLESDFVQIKQNKRFSDQTYRGKMYIERPGKMRWDYSEPKGRTLVSDGKSMTLYDPEDHQAMITPISSTKDLPPPFSFLWGNDNLENNFVIEPSKTEKPGKEGEMVLEVVSKKEIPNVTKVLLWVNTGKKPMVSRTKVFFIYGDENELQFSNTKVNPKIASEKFHFQLPKGVARVDTGLSK